MIDTNTLTAHVGPSERGFTIHRTNYDLGQAVARIAHAHGLRIQRNQTTSRRGGWQGYCAYLAVPVNVPGRVNILHPDVVVERAPFARHYTPSIRGERIALESLRDAITARAAR